MNTLVTKRTIITAAVMLALAVALIPLFHTVSAASTNLESAMEKYKVTDDRVIDTGKASTSKIQDGLSDASASATEKKPYIVYVKSGTINSGFFNVPENVILVSEKKVKYNKTGIDANGSVYGGTFDGKKKVDILINVRTTKFSKVNGNVEYTTVKNGTDTGISCIKTARVNSVNNNNVSNCVKGGIGCYNGAVIKYIKSNTIKNNGKGKTGSGINIVGASVYYIEKNTVSENKGHGISTDYDVYKKKCSIKKIDGNTVKSNGNHGIYLERSKVTKSMKGNTVKSNKKCGIRIDKKSSVKGYKKNTVTKNKSNLSNAGKLSKN